MNILIIVLLSALDTAAATEPSPTTHEMLVRYYSYANPSGRCVQCGGGSSPGCCDVPTPVPLDQTCHPDACDTAYSRCFRALESSSICTYDENQQNIYPGRLLDTSSTTFDNTFFGYSNPRRFTGTGAWQGIQMLHTFHECQQNETTCLVDFNTVIDTIFINITIAVGTSIPKNTYNGSAGIAKLTVSFELRCATGFYGQNCSTQCSNFVSCAGCGLSGFTGQFCQFSTGNCSAEYCNGNGQCRENSSLCDCHPGFTGAHCETNIDDCDEAFCVNGDCVDEVNGFRCDCNPGFTGDRCETNINDCEGVFCASGICVDEINGFRCSCDIGFTSDRCETNIDDCEGVNCNYGVCVDGVNSAECKCTPGFTGEVCDIDLDDCEGVDCGNGVCVDEISHFRCECNTGFTGESCNIFEDTWLGGLVGGVVGGLLLVTMLICILINIMCCWFRRKMKNEKRAAVGVPNKMYTVSPDEIKMAEKQAYELTRQGTDAVMNTNEVCGVTGEGRMTMTQNQVYGVCITDKNMLQKAGSLVEDYDYVPV